MPELTVDITTAQLAALKVLEPGQSVKAVVQAHVDTWLTPLVAQAREEDRKAVHAAYLAADPAVQARVRKELGLGEPR
jgi:hypothetical protein